jgi:CRP-like cAMP-binding protein
MSAIESTDELYGLLARAGEVRRLAAGSVIFERGEDAHSMFVVTGGTVALKLENEILDTVEAPGLLGEMALIDYEPRSLTAVASSDVELVEIPERRF